MWDLSEPGIEPVSPALAGERSSTVPSEEARLHLLYLDGRDDKNPASVHLQILEKGSKEEK